ncbi:MAG: hypothetical protein AVDCRST_MAG68-2037, partial [uncultured Gemmatimonadetes bacterium]
ERPQRAVRNHPDAGDGGDHLRDARRDEAVRNGLRRRGRVLWVAGDPVPVRQRRVRDAAGAGGRRDAGGGPLHPLRGAAPRRDHGGGHRDGARVEGLLPPRRLRVRAPAARQQRGAVPDRLRRAGAGQRDRPRAPAGGGEPCPGAADGV